MEWERVSGGMLNSINSRNMKKSLISNLLILLAVLTASMSCSEWKETESVRIEVTQPWASDPSLWEDYKASLRSYKQSQHYIAYARLENSPDKATSEKSFMRSLPDSLDIVSLTNAENFSQYDAADMDWMRSVGTRVLYQIDIASVQDGVETMDDISRLLDMAIMTVSENRLDGFAFTGIPRMDGPLSVEMSNMIVQRLSNAKSEGMLLVFEGDPLFVTQENLDKIDLFVLDSHSMEYSYDVKMAVQYAVSILGIPEKKILLSASIDGSIMDESLEVQPSLNAIVERVVSLGPLGGFAVYDIESDYYNYEGNYIMTRNAIQQLNYSK